MGVVWAEKAAQSLGWRGGLSVCGLEGKASETGAGEGEAENDTGEGGRDQTQLGRSMDFNLCAKEAGAEFTREVTGTACFFIFIF